MSKSQKSNYRVIFHFFCGVIFGVLAGWLFGPRHHSNPLSPDDPSDPLRGHLLPLPPFHYHSFVPVIWLVCYGVTGGIIGIFVCWICRKIRHTETCSQTKDDSA
jgi:hypothetical protein